MARSVFLIVLLVIPYLRLAVASPLEFRPRFHSQHVDLESASSTAPIAPFVTAGKKVASVRRVPGPTDSAHVPWTSEKYLAKRLNSSCPQLSAGFGIATTPDTVPAFLANQAYALIAQRAQTPQGYTNTFTNLQASTQASDYITYTALQSYDPIKCQQLCDADTGCSGFNIYFERDPIVDPECSANPPSTVAIKCARWSSTGWMNPSLATNVGQFRGPPDANGVQFHVVIAGSNGYTKNPAPPSIRGFNGPTEFGGAINDPFINGTHTYMGVEVFALGPLAGQLNPQICAETCVATTAYNSRHPRADGTYDSCNFFNIFVVSDQNVPQGMSCSMYTTAWSKKYSTNYGQFRGPDYFSVSQSYGYTLNSYAGPTPR